MMSMSTQERELCRLVGLHLSALEEHLARHYQMSSEFPLARPGAGQPTVSVRGIQRCFLPRGANYERGQIEFMVYVTVLIAIPDETRGILEHRCNAVLEGRIVRTEDGRIDLKYIGKARIDPPPNGASLA